MSDASFTERVPLDLVAVAALAALALVVLPVGGTGPVVPPLDAGPVALLASVGTAVLGILAVLFLPGYAVVAVLFPGHEPAVEELDAEGEPMAPRFQFRSRTGIDAIERVTLAVGLSAAVTPAVALVCNFLPWGVSPGPLVSGVAGVTLAAAAVAAVRRWQRPPDERFAPALRPKASPLLGTAGESGSDEKENYPAASAVLVLGLLVAVAGVGYALAVPMPGQQFTELYLLAENDDGTLVADDYPEFVQGEPYHLVAGIENHEGERTAYAMVAVLQQVRTDEEGLAVTAEQELRRGQLLLAADETRRVPISIGSNATDDGSGPGDQFRVRVLLFRGSVPDEPRAATAYRTVDLWLNGTAPSNRTTSVSRTASGS